MNTNTVEKSPETILSVQHVNKHFKMKRTIFDSLLKHRFPYNVEVEGNDEIARLNDQLEELAALARDRIKE